MWWPDSYCEHINQLTLCQDQEGPFAQLCRQPFLLLMGLCFWFLPHIAHLSVFPTKVASLSSWAYFTLPTPKIQHPILSPVQAVLCSSFSFRQSHTEFSFYWLNEFIPLWNSTSSNLALNTVTFKTSSYIDYLCIHCSTAAVLFSSCVLTSFDLTSTCYSCSIYTECFLVLFFSCIQYSWVMTLVLVNYFAIVHVFA